MGRAHLVMSVLSALTLASTACDGSATSIAESAPPTSIIQTAVEPPAASAAAAAETVGRDSAARSRATVTYADVTGHDRSVFIEIRRPSRSASSGAAPVLIWSHGGTTGRTTPVKVGKEWGDVATSSGYAVVAIAHPFRSDGEWDALCAAVGAPICDEFHPMRWDRPADLTAVIDWLEANTDAAPGLDLARIVYGGHSAGGFSVMITAGARWPYVSELAPTPDPRPMAFIVASAPGVEARGFDTASFDDLRGPLLIVSGDGDTTTGSPASERRKTLDMLPAGLDAVSVWVGDEDTRHTTFDLDTSSCRRAGGTADRCNEIVNTLGRVGRAFLDAVASPGAYDRDHFATMVAERAPDYFEVLTPG